MQELGKALVFFDKEERSFQEVLDDCVRRYVTKQDVKYSIVYDLYKDIMDRAELKADYALIPATANNGRTGNTWSMEGGRIADFDFNDVADDVLIMSSWVMTPLGTFNNRISTERIILNNDFNGKGLTITTTTGTRLVTRYTQLSYDFGDSTFKNSIDTDCTLTVAGGMGAVNLVPGGIPFFPAVPLKNFTIGKKNLIFLQNFNEYKILSADDDFINPIYGGTEPTVKQIMQTAVQLPIYQAGRANNLLARFESAAGHKYSYFVESKDFINRDYQKTNYFSCAHLKLLLKLRNQFSETSQKINKFLIKLNLEENNILAMIRTANTNCSLNKIGNYLNSIMDIPGSIRSVPNLKTFLGLAGILYKPAKRSSISLLRGINQFLINISVGLEPFSFKDRHKFVCLDAQKYNYKPNFIRYFYQTYFTDPDRKRKILFIMNRLLPSFNEKLSYTYGGKKQVFMQGGLYGGDPTRRILLQPALPENMSGLTFPNNVSETEITNIRGAIYNSYLPFLRGEYNYPVYSDTKSFIQKFILGIVNMFTVLDKPFGKNIILTENIEENNINLYSLVSKLNRCVYIPTTKRMRRDPPDYRFLFIGPPKKNKKHYWHMRIGDYSFWINIWFIVDYFNWPEPKSIDRITFILP